MIDKGCGLAVLAGMLAYKGCMGMYGMAQDSSQKSQARGVMCIHAIIFAVSDTLCSCMLEVLRDLTIVIAHMAGCRIPAITNLRKTGTG